MSLEDFLQAGLDLPYLTWQAKIRRGSEKKVELNPEFNLCCWFPCGLTSAAGFHAV